MLRLTISNRFTIRQHLKITAQMEQKVLFLLAGFVVLLIASRNLRADSPPTVTHDVAFVVGTKAAIHWFEVDNPAIGGTISVINQPYPSTDALNSAVVDVSRNRLMYVDDTRGGQCGLRI